MSTLPRAFLEELATDAGIPASLLVIVKKGGVAAEQGTWIHPDVTINLGQWCSPKFAVAVSRWVRDWITGKSKIGLPYHIQRYMANMSEVPHSHFSILNELIFGLMAPLEARGYTLPENMVPDISQGRMFCKWLLNIKLINKHHTHIDTYMKIVASCVQNSTLLPFLRIFAVIFLKNDSPGLTRLK